MDRGAWWATVHGVAESWTQLSDFHYYITRQVVTDKSKIWTYMFDSKSKLLNAVLLNEKNIKKSEKYLKGSYSGVWKRRIPEVSHD